MRVENMRRGSFILSVSLLGVLLGGTATPAYARQKARAGASEAQAAQPYGKKLVLKDGSYQIVRSYQVEGNRVRYFSVVRSEWEEIPASMVDWNATKKAEEEQIAASKALAVKMKEEQMAEKAASITVDASIEVLPGVFLPPGEGMFILDKHAIFSLSHSEASSKLSKGHLLEQVLVPFPVIPSRHVVALKGAHASFRITNSIPEFYLRTTDPGEPNVELIKAHVHGQERRLENIDTLLMQQTQKRKTIPLQEWPVANGVYRFTLGEPLKPGEYALAEVTTKGGMSFEVWDFGVDKPK